jgi:hypothetical protein
MVRQMNMQKLLKALEMTTSAFDNEALNAMRLANSMLAMSGLTWADVLKVPEAPKPTLLGKRRASYNVMKPNLGPAPDYIRRK